MAEERLANKNYSQDELDWFGILTQLWQQKSLILLTTLIGLALGASFILLRSPVYEAQAFISSPTLGDITPLNQGRSRDKKALLPAYTEKNVYRIFKGYLLSESSKRAFFNTVFLPSLSAKKRSQYTHDALFKKMSKLLFIREVPKSVPTKFVVTVKGTDPERDVEWVKKYIDIVRQNALDHMVTDVKRQNEGVALGLQSRSDSVREIAKLRRVNRLTQLKEAINIAQALGNNQSVASNSGVDLIAQNSPGMMYLRGVKALRSELNNLENRRSDDAFASKLPAIQSQLNFYQKMTVNPNEVAMFRLDGEIEQPDMPVFPQKEIILPLALFLGLTVGIILARMRRRIPR
jgi:chain length determinant protein (polysaccharide antigen chain regulator)